MSSIELLLRLLQSNYAADGASLHLFPASVVETVRAVLRVTLTDGTAWIMRAYQRDQPVPDWLAGCGTPTTEAWLLSRAATLEYLAQQGYAAPQVIPTRSGALLAEMNDWCALATTFIAGDVVEPIPESLYAIGATIGKLHRIGLVSGPEALARVGKSWWYRDLAIPAALDLYTRVVPDLPAAWIETHAAFCATLRAIQHAADLPQAVIHGDAWAGNAVHTPDGCVLIDWEPSGQGLPVLDLGRLLLYGHQALTTNITTLITPAAWRVNAIIDGYCSERRPTAAEEAVLLAAIRFNIAIGAASHFRNAQRNAWRNPFPEPLTRRVHWYNVSAEIATFAHKRLSKIS